MDRYSQISPSKRSIYDLDNSDLQQRSSSPLQAPLDLSCHNRHSSPKNTSFDQETAYDYSLTGVPHSNHSHGLQESVIPTSQRLDYSQYPSESAHHGLYPYDQEFAYKISSTCSPPPASANLYSHHDYHQYREKPPLSPNPIEANSVTYSPSHYRSPQLPYSPSHDSSWTSSEAFDSAYLASGMSYHPLTVSTSQMSLSGHEVYLNPQDQYESVSPYGLVSPTGSSYGAYAVPFSPQHGTHEVVGAHGYDSRISSSDSCVSPEPSTTAIPESLARYPKGKARRQKVYHKHLTEEEILQRKRAINNDSSRRHRQRKNMSMKQLEEEEQKEMTRQAQLTKTRDMLKHQTELLGSLIGNVDLNRK